MSAVRRAKLLAGYLRYNASDKGRKRSARYEASAKGRERADQYRSTIKGILARDLSYRRARTAGLQGRMDGMNALLASMGIELGEVIAGKVTR